MVHSNTDVSDEELMTVFFEVEALLNFRPVQFASHSLHGNIGGVSAPSRTARGTDGDESRVNFTLSEKMDEKGYEVKCAP